MTYTEFESEGLGINELGLYNQVVLEALAKSRIPTIGTKDKTMGDLLTETRNILKGSQKNKI